LVLLRVHVCQVSTFSHTHIYTHTHTHTRTHTHTHTHTHSHECVPAGEWACPECVGQKMYDEQLSLRIKASRERWLTGKMSAKERDGFSQLVFDLLCSCAWCV